MAVRRGLNKDRGLGSLIPQKKEKIETAEAKLQENTENKEIDKEETADQAENNKAVKVENSASEKTQKKPQKAVSGKSLKKTEDFEKTVKEQTEEERYQAVEQAACQETQKCKAFSVGENKGNLVGNKGKRQQKAKTQNLMCQIAPEMEWNET